MEQKMEAMERHRVSLGRLFGGGMRVLGRYATKH